MEAFFWGLLMLQKMIKPGETIRRPNERRKPVMAALPQGISADQIRAEIARQLEAENTIDVAQAAEEKSWAPKVREWILGQSSKP